MARCSSGRVVAIVMVYQDSDGGMLLVGSRRVRSTQIEINRGFEEYNDQGWRGTRAVPALDSVHIEAECSDIYTRYAEPMATMPHLDQRGIYLPDMSFRALPAPEDTR